MERSLDDKDVAHSRMKGVAEAVKAIVTIPGMLVLLFLLFIKRAMS